MHRMRPCPVATYILVDNTLKTMASLIGRHQLLVQSLVKRNSTQKELPVDRKILKVQLTIQASQTGLCVSKHIYVSQFCFGGQKVEVINGSNEREDMAHSLGLNNT